MSGEVIDYNLQVQGSTAITHRKKGTNNSKGKTVVLNSANMHQLGGKVGEPINMRAGQTSKAAHDALDSSGLPSLINTSAALTGANTMPGKYLMA